MGNHGLKTANELGAFIWYSYRRKTACDSDKEKPAFKARTQKNCMEMARSVPMRYRSSTEVIENLCLKVESGEIHSNGFKYLTTIDGRNVDPINRPFPTKPCLISDSPYYNLSDRFKEAWNHGLKTANELDAFIRQFCSSVNARNSGKDKSSFQDSKTFSVTMNPEFIQCHLPDNLKQTSQDALLTVGAWETAWGITD